MADFQARFVNDGDKPEWRIRFHGYAEFYGSCLVRSILHKTVIFMK